jgi:uncharacterized membrane protein YdbT with pleckstrin-like domain
VSRLAELRKAVAAASGLLAQVIELGVLNGTALHWTQTASGVLAALLVYLVPNAPKKAAPVK